MISEKNKILGVLLLAFALRVVGVGFGLPNLYHQDEPIIVNHALAIGAGGWNPHFFVIPSFTIYLLFGAQAIYFLIGKMLGQFPTAADFGLMFMRDPSSVYVIGRLLLGVAFGVANVWILWECARRVFGSRIAFWSALLLAITPMHVQHSHYIYADIPLTFAITLCFFVLLKILDTPTVSRYFVFGALVGWASSIKYTALYFAPTLVAAHLAAQPKVAFRKSEVAKVFVAAISCIAAFIVFAPFSVLDFKNFIEQMAHQGHAQAYVGVAHHAIYSIVGGCGILMPVLALIGIVILASQEPKKALTTFLFIMLYYGVSIFYSQRFDRYMLPLIPVLIVLAAITLDKIMAWRVKLFKWGLSAALIIELIAPSIYFDALLCVPDTRDRCAQWFRENVDPDSVIAVDNRFFAPHLALLRNQIEQKYSQLGSGQNDEVRKKRLDLMLKATEGQKGYRVYLITTQANADAPAFLFLKPFIKADKTAFKEAGIQYLIVHYEGALDGPKRVLDVFADELQLEKIFSPYRDSKRKLSLDPEASTAMPHLAKELFSRHSPGPYLEVYRVRHE